MMKVSPDVRRISTFLLQRFVFGFCFAEIEYSFILRFVFFCFVESEYFFISRFVLFCIANFQIVVEAIEDP